MFKKRSLPLDALTPRRQAVVKPRLHKFPPLRRRWQPGAPPALEDASLDPARLQQQLKEGFQEGLNSGFAQGMEEGKEEGYQEGVRLGFDEGLRKGLSEGRQQGRQQFQQAAAPLEEMAAALQQFLGGYEQRRREELLQLVEKVTRQVIRCELALQPTQLLALVEEALVNLAQPPAKIRVQLNAEEYRRISEAEPDKAREWGLMADPALAPGECRVVTDTTEIDLGCQHRLDQCVSVLKDTLLEREQHERG
ncbi:flagellar assembly protein FliH [Pluralibacter gergoviae]|uniref:flagellar assembly protein FliH n=1 Tax=Pluralibacter gergoviae TaxID=61647 RepID=UPI0005EC56D6|nr:flagellar assembly protein FliH [Pluralibacter gergoviae]KJM59203.1 flagellar assembly protein H [Pluralibacter gergoviae]KMK19913.1 flagellar assembly protein H [Pluralibacter gergoviae]OUQ99702.1 flagellar assembly protein FliH [Pluralibacter gergoviae]